METAQVDFVQLQNDLQQAAANAASLIRYMDAIGRSLATSRGSSSVADQWARTWGETTNKKDAAKMLGISATYLYTLIGDGHIQTAPDGRVLTRSAAEWANSQIKKRKTAQKWRV